ncbi:hypothetical protein GWK41_07005 [Persephonella atlantica]|uniref:TrbL/VirB6 plasmid conjugal transfer protein n=1 Tax=Persephonella atlantica TaxID=2699429 RepID=A0ABS1GIS3_9AQUI|nr:hypothetical protein [Persephonella atlantica]MBK3332814.1 hypothetical protein [Persephonella atlantica]
MEIKKAAKIAALLSVSVFLFFIPPFSFPFLDDKGSSYVENTLKKLTITYTAVRGLNAGISVIKESEIDLSPGGVGATIAAGEVLDPLDDLVERFSSVLLFSIISIGVQKLLMLVSINLFFKLLSISLLLFAIYTAVKKDFFLHTGIKIAIIAFVLRIFVPFTGVVNDYVYGEFFKENVEKAKKQITYITELIKIPENSLNVSQIKQKVQKLKDYSSKTIDSILILVTAFIIQTVIIPLITGYAVLKIVKRSIGHF